MMPPKNKTPRHFLLRIDGVFVRNSRKALVTYTQEGAHKAARQRRAQSYSVVLYSPLGRSIS